MSHIRNKKCRIYYFSKIGTYTCRDIVKHNKGWKTGKGYPLRGKTNVILVRNERERWASGVAQEFAQLITHEILESYNKRQIDNFFRTIFPPNNPPNKLLSMHHAYLKETENGGYIDSWFGFKLPWHVPYVRSMWDNIDMFVEQPNTYYCYIDKINTKKFWDKIGIPKQIVTRSNKSLGNKKYVKEYFLNILDDDCMLEYREQLDKNQDYLDNIPKEKWLCL